MSCSPNAVVQILVNEVTQNYPADNTYPNTPTGELLGSCLSSWRNMSIVAWTCPKCRHCYVIVIEHRTLYLKTTMCSVVQFITRQPVPVPMDHHLPSESEKFHEQLSKITIQRIYGRVQIVKKSVTATVRKFKTSRGNARQIVEALEWGSSIENIHTRIWEHMYPTFWNARIVGNLIHYWQLKTWAKEAVMLIRHSQIKASN